MPECRSCHAAIRFATTEHGKSIPIDLAPRADGNLVLLGANRGGAPLAVAYDPVKHLGKQRFASHFASCPHAKTHRRAR